MKPATLALSLVILSGSLAALPALAHPSGKGPFGGGATFDEIDADGDGRIDAAEMQGRRAAAFAAADTNGDGGLDLGELEAQAARAGEARAREMLRRLDADGDGLLAAAELPAPARSGRLFERLDSDGDGALSREEFEAARERMAKRRARDD